MKDKPNIPLVRPALVPWKSIEPKFAEVWKSGQLTTGEHTRNFEKALCEVTGAKYAVALSSCTSGLMLLLRALDISGEVILPSFTWASTGHALVWNQIKPVFADCTNDTFTIDPADVERKLTSKTQAIFAANVFGIQPDMDALQNIADKARIPLLCDSAQAIGAKYKGLPAGQTAFAEVFSLSPTKVVTAVEGGIITTSDKPLADKLRQMRDYGKSADGFDVEFFGLSARISEFHSIVGNQNLKRYRDLIRSRNQIAEKYRQALKKIPGIVFQSIPEGYVSSYNYFVILVEEPGRVLELLTQRNIQSKRYFYPPLHKLTSYTKLNISQAGLPVTEKISESSLALPFYSNMPDREVTTVIEALFEILV